MDCKSRSLLAPIASPGRLVRGEICSTIMRLIRSLCNGRDLIVQFTIRVEDGKE